MKRTRHAPKPVRFANKQALKSLQKLPRSAKEPFISDLEDVIAYGLEPTLETTPLPGKTIELKINGSPAYRCVYQVRSDMILVLHAFRKTCEGPDKKNLETLDLRLRNLDPEQFC